MRRRGYIGVMEAIPPQYWANHHTRRVPPPGVRRDPLPGTRKLPVQVRTKIEGEIKAELLQPKSLLDTMLFQVPDLPPVILRWQRFGDTALAATVVRPPTLDIECVTLCLGGIDKMEDEAALNAAGSFLIGGDERPELRQAIDGLIGMLRQEPRPLGAHLHFDEASYDSQAVRVVTGGLVQAFFDQFGADKLDPRSGT